MKYVIKNCPNYYYEENWEHPHRCNLTDGDWSCEIVNTPDDEYGFNCVIKQIVRLCKEKIKVCEGCSKIADINIDCVECDEKGEANISRAIVNLLKIEEVNE